ncbi:hypothetical protein scyTo_0018486, partial [Scyliorhinus torazame]|nr:hypothetical protein [Scyliorhinus torazame]
TYALLDQEAFIPVSHIMQVRVNDNLDVLKQQLYGLLGVQMTLA